MPNVQLKNQIPFDFSNYQPQFKSFDDPLEKELKETVFEPLVDQIFAPINQGTPTVLTIDNQVMHKTDIIDQLTKDIANPDVDVKNNEINSLFIHQSSRYRDHNPQNWQQVIANSYLLKNKFPLPTPSMIYTYDTDIQNQAKDVLINDSADHRNQLRLGLYGNLLSNPLNSSWLFILTNPTDYQNFKEELNTNIQMYNKDAQVAKFNQDVQQINLDKNNNFTSWITSRNSDQDSFNRFVMFTLDQYQNQNMHEILPLNLKSRFNPVGFSFINIETLANSTQHEYNQELKQLQNITNKLVSFKYLKLTKIKSAQEISDSNNQTRQYTKSGNGSIIQRKSRGFHKTIPSTKQQLNRMVKIVKKHVSSLESSNTYRNHRYTFMRPNRRHPNDMNLRGRIQQIKYRPDIHIYLDSSGSISESQYKAAVMLLIKIAKKLKTDLYFTSFSDEISQPFKLITKNASVKQIYAQIQRIPKVGGGTEYENVWKMIDTIDVQNKKLSKASRLNFMITDFCYGIRDSYNPNLRHASTKNTYYIPLAANQREYDEIYDLAMRFANSLIDKNDLNIKSRIIM